jgi:hypothetical protein
MMLSKIVQWVGHVICNKWADPTEQQVDLVETDCEKLATNLQFVTEIVTSMELRPQVRSSDNKFMC